MVVSQSWVFGLVIPFLTGVTIPLPLTCATELSSLAQETPAFHMDAPYWSYTVEGLPLSRPHGRLVSVVLCQRPAPRCQPAC